MGYAGAILSAAGLGLSAYQGQTALSHQKKSIKAQDLAQSQATQASLASKRDAELAINKADRKKPDIAAILAASKTGSGLNNTMLTGAFQPLGGSR